MLLLSQIQFRFLPSAVALALVLCGSVQSTVADDDPARDLVVRVTDRIFSKIAENPELVLESEETAKKFIERELVPVLDIERFGRIILAANWKKATPEQQNKFVAVLQEFLVQSFAIAVVGVSNEIIDYADRVQVMNSKKGRNEDNVTVAMQIELDDKKVRTVEFRMGRKNDVWKVYDVVFEGVSFAINYRTILKSEIQKSGLDSVIDNLSEKLEPVT